MSISLRVLLTFSRPRIVRRMQLRCLKLFRAITCGFLSGCEDIFSSANDSNQSAFSFESSNRFAKLAYQSLDSEPTPNPTIIEPKLQLKKYQHLQLKHTHGNIHHNNRLVLDGRRGLSLCARGVLHYIVFDR